MLQWTLVNISEKITIGDLLIILQPKNDPPTVCNGNNQLWVYWGYEDDGWDIKMTRGPHIILWLNERKIIFPSFHHTVCKIINFVRTANANKLCCQ